MSRAQAAQEVSPENFAGLLDRLTRRAHTASSSHGQEADFETLSDQVFISERAQRIRSSAAPDGKSTLIRNLGKGQTPQARVPQAAPKRPTPESADLTYERALRLHSRYRAGTQQDEEIARVAVTAPVPLLSRKPGPSRPPEPTVKQAAPQRIAAATQARPPKKQPEPRSALPVALPVRPQEGTVAGSAKSQIRKLASTSKNQEQASPAPTKARPRSGSVKSVSPANRGDSGPGRKSLSSPHTNRNPQSSPKPSPRPEYGLEVGQDERLHQLQRQALQPDYRRAIISVRLNEEEFARLRQRAEESGISVSAYMRSCVLEAEHLRAQVKQALAAMRPYSRPSEPAQLSSACHPGREGFWRMLMSRSANFLFGPWFRGMQRCEANTMLLKHPGVQTPPPELLSASVKSADEARPSGEMTHSFQRIGRIGLDRAKR